MWFLCMFVFIFLDKDKGEDISKIQDDMTLRRFGIQIVPYLFIYVYLGWA